MKRIKVTLYGHSARIATTFLIDPKNEQNESLIMSGTMLPGEMYDNLMTPPQQKRYSDALANDGEYYFAHDYTAVEKISDMAKVELTNGILHLYVREKDVITGRYGYAPVTELTLTRSANSTHKLGKYYASFPASDVVGVKYGYVGYCQKHGGNFVEL